MQLAVHRVTVLVGLIIRSHTGPAPRSLMETQQHHGGGPPTRDIITAQGPRLIACSAPAAV